MEHMDRGSIGFESSFGPRIRSLAERTDLSELRHFSEYIGGLMSFSAAGARLGA